jgi:hypothetical protein
LGIIGAESVMSYENERESLAARPRMQQYIKIAPKKELPDWAVAILGIGFWVILFISIALVVLARNAN